jgi:fatty acid desaturase
MRELETSQGSFSLAQARRIVADLFQPRPWIYWTDFLVTIAIGHAAFAVTRRLYDFGFQPLSLRLAIQAVTLLITCLAYYRAVMFAHEVVHLPERKLRAFRFAWNLLCGIPFLVPSFTYATHLDHHRRTMYGTDDDGEYLPLARGSRWWILLYLSQCLWVPPLAVVRFLLLSPLAWICPPARRWIHRHASSLVMDPAYLRPLPTPQALAVIRWQELGCLMFLLGFAVVPPVFLGRWPVSFVVQAYLVSVLLILLNSLRTLAAHRWTSDGHEATFVEQMLDTVTIDSPSPLEKLLNPLNLGYHSTHHLFPALPYHNLRHAHKRLMEQLPADSPYRLTVERSVAAAIWRLLVRQRKSPLPAASAATTIQHPLHRAA